MGGMRAPLSAATVLAVALTGSPSAGSPADTTPANSSEPPASTATGAALPDELATGTAYTVTGALAELPARVLDGDGFLLTTANLDAAAEQAGLTRSDGDDLGWLVTLTGDSEAARGEHPPIVIERPYWMTWAIEDPGAMRDQVGWDLDDVGSFVAVSQPRPDGFTVVAGDLDDDMLPDRLPEVADDVVTLGEGDDSLQDLENPNALDNLGTPQRIATDDDRLAFGPILDEIVAWEDDDAPRDVATDDPGVLVVANALDDAGSVSAVVANMPRADDAAITVPIDVVGIGFAADEGSAVITVAYHVVEAGDADRAVDEIDAAFTAGLATNPGPPISELVSVEDVVATGDAVVATLTVPDGETPGMVISLLRQASPPFATTP